MTNHLKSRTTAGVEKFLELYRVEQVYRLIWHSMNCRC